MRVVPVRVDIAQDSLGTDLLNFKKKLPNAVLEAERDGLPFLHGFPGKPFVCHAETNHDVIRLLGSHQSLEILKKMLGVISMHCDIHSLVVVALFQCSRQNPCPPLVLERPRACSHGAATNGDSLASGRWWWDCRASWCKLGIWERQRFIEFAIIEFERCSWHGHEVSIETVLPLYVAVLSQLDILVLNIPVTMLAHVDTGRPLSVSQLITDPANGVHLNCLWHVPSTDCCSSANKLQVLTGSDICPNKESIHGPVRDSLLST
mmetsp:Transcript_757/g.1419  ORF Transcript_757/g.1419 Transcript_757/m.1419 type:complete len:263 (+) Transcript_757:146-934(+)